MIYLLNGCPKLLWCNCSDVWWWNESNISHHSDDLCKSFTKGFMWWILINHHRSKLNITASMVITRSQYQPFTKTIFSSPETYGNILKIFGVGLNPPKLMYKINWDAWICIVLLEILVCGRLCLVLAISDIDFTEDKARGMWRI